ncbi:MAG: HupE/UreJ family protein [Novosphingobium sp.]|nr:HupE/UreJ family protein [Novosphingobium sp.]
MHEAHSARNRALEGSAALPRRPGPRCSLAAWPAARVALAIFAIFLSFGVGPERAAAHNLPYSLASVSFPSGGIVRIEIRCHLIPLLLGQLQGVPSAEMIRQFDALTPAEVERRETEAAQQILASLSLRAEGKLIDDIAWNFPAFKTIADDAAAPQYNATPSPPLVLIARIPPDTATVDIALPPQFGSAVLTVKTPGGQEYSQPLTDGVRSAPIRLQSKSGWQDALGTFWRFIGLGFEHILPSGLDHILFVIALAISTPRLVQLLKLATTFTVAHSITLSLAAFGIVRLPPAVVEPAIAFSIAVVALLSVFRPEQKIRADRLALVFCFGLLHGMGFASALQETGLPRGQELPALGGFNLGIEFGQVAIIVAVLALVGLLRDKAHYRSHISSPINVCIAVVGLFWTVQRIFA